MKILHGVPHGGLWIRSHGLPKKIRQAHLQEVGLTRISGNHDFFNIFSTKTNFMTNRRANSRIDSKTIKHQQEVLLV